jgi:cytochrome c
MPAEEPQPEPAPQEQAATEPGAPEPTEPGAQTAQPASAVPHADKLELAKKSGCLACHAVDKKVVGPAWKDVAARYAGDPQAKSKLVEKVAKGGRGNWTDVVGNMAMPPYSPRVSDADIETLVDFVLSLNNT